MKTTIAVLDKIGGNTTLSSLDMHNCIRLGDKAVFFEGRIFSPTSNISDKEAIAKKLLQTDHLRGSESFLTEVEGDFAFIITEPGQIIVGRDPVGVQPLYYGENKCFVAFASNRKALWKLGINEARSFPPGHLAFVSRDGFKFKPVKTLVYSEPKPVTMKKAAETLQKMLEQSVHSRVSGTKEVAVAFSGGLDSSVVAFLAKKCQVNVQLVHVSLENQPETEEAKKAADVLNLPLQVHLFREEDVQNVVPKVVELIEESDPVKASIGVAFYWTAEKTAESGFKVLLAGQGADELFGGYQRYATAYLSHEKEKVRKIMFDDVVGIHESNLERDVKICRFHNLELRLPFVSPKIIEFALALPIELKIKKGADSLRKLVLRKVAKHMGLPASISEKPKRAMQYSTGINDALKRTAKKQNATVAEYVTKLFLSQMTGN
ncbi:MAG: asparagine synthetase B [Candidatus Bathyarchaeota archaeon]|nr:asparagine synthetase B [Candidatus Bathyarchaeota archaeon]